MKQKKKNVLAVCLLLICMLMIMGAGKEMTMDADQRIAYQNEDAEYFLIRTASSPDSAKSSYANKYVMMLGKVRSKNGKKGIKLGMISEFSHATLNCSTARAEVQDSLERIHVGDYVKVYGKLTVGAFDGKWTLSIDKIERTFETEVSRTAFSMISGKTLDPEKMETRTLNNKGVTYYIPKEWADVEKSLLATGLGKVEGYQYCLNEINEESVYPESLFVFYFDNEAMLMNTVDKSKTEQIERAIVNNLLKEDPGAADKKVTTYYGATYHYFQQAYKSTIGKNYHGEFIFQPDGKKGFLVFFYVYYNEKAHIDDVMLMLRMVKP